MGIWDSYGSRMAASGPGRRVAAVARERRLLEEKIPASLSYHHLTVDGEPREMAVINSDNLNQKTLCSMPGDDIRNGALVEWMGNRWLVTEKDANNELYTRATMLQCNYLVRWVADDDSIIERWCIIEDGTKYLTGEYGDNQFVITRGDSRISMTIARDKYSLQLGRDSRFLIDDYGSGSVLAYRLTKPFKLGGGYNGDGVFHFVLQECNTEDSDNFQLHIANYYDHFPRDGVQEGGVGAPRDEDVAEFLNGGAAAPSESDEPKGKKVWL